MAGTPQQEFDRDMQRSRFAPTFTDVAQMVGPLLNMIGPGMKFILCCIAEVAYKLVTMMPYK